MSTKLEMMLDFTPIRTPCICQLGHYDTIYMKGVRLHYSKYLDSTMFHTHKQSMVYNSR